MAPAPAIDTLLRIRMRAHGFAGKQPTSVAGVVDRVFALQAQDTAAARLGVRARSVGLDRGEVTRACNVDRSVVRTWAMRGTLHLLPAADVGWVVALLGPRFCAKGRGRRLQLGLDDALCERALPIIADVLGKEGPLERAVLVDRLFSKGIRCDPTTQAPAHLMFYAATRGLICRGPDRADDEPTYTLVTDWAGPQRELGPDEALAELVRRYLRGHAPADERDFTLWSGLTLADAKRGFALAGRQILTPKERPGTPAVRLIPSFDDWLLGYADRDASLPPAFAKRIQAGGGWIHPVVLVDGRVVAKWRLERTSAGLRVVVEPFEELPRRLHAALEAEAIDVGRFLGKPAELVIAAVAP